MFFALCVGVSDTEFELSTQLLEMLSIVIYFPNAESTYSVGPGFVVIAHANIGVPFSDLSTDSTTCASAAKKRPLTSG